MKNFLGVVIIILLGLIIFLQLTHSARESGRNFELFWRIRDIQSDIFGSTIIDTHYIYDVDTVSMDKELLERVLDGDTILPGWKKMTEELRHGITYDDTTDEDWMEFDITFLLKDIKATKPSVASDKLLNLFRRAHFGHSKLIIHYEDDSIPSGSPTSSE